MEKVYLVCECRRVDYEGGEEIILFACSTYEKAAKAAKKYIQNSYGMKSEDENGRFMIEKTSCTKQYVQILSLDIDSEDPNHEWN